MLRITQNGLAYTMKESAKDGSRYFFSRTQQKTQLDCSLLSIKQS